MNLSKGVVKERQLEVTKLPEYAFLRGVAVKDVVQLRLLSNAEKKSRKWGEPDVEIKSMWFKNVNLQQRKTVIEYVSRDVANNKFYTSDGKKLKARFLRANQRYIVTSDLDNIPVYVLEPSGKKVVYLLNGKEVPKDTYLVFVGNGNNILFDAPVCLKAKYFNRMIQLKETSKDLAARVRRYDTAVEDRKQAQYRVVANVLDKNTFKKLGYILSFIDESGKNREKFYSLGKILKLLESNNIRNMKMTRGMKGDLQESLTYGRLVELPTHFMDSSKSKK